MTEKLKITQIRSTIGRPAVQGRIIRSLGIKRMHHTVEHKNDPVILGQINKVSHLLKVEEV